tara:strand:+ start:1066 stop:2001 length:936 start_codon:yes stop_codon:yes gene_type:complete
MKKSQYNNILIVKHGSLGDIAFSLLAIETIRKYFNNSNIDLITEGKYANFLKKSGNFNSIIEDSRKGILNSLKVIFKIYKNKYDLIIDLQNSKRTNYYWLILKYFSKSKINGSRSNCDIRYRIPIQGTESPQKGLYNQLKLLGINDISDDLGWLLINTYKISEKKIIMFIPSVSKSGKYKQWSPQKFAELAKILENKSFKICVVGQDSDKEITDLIKKNCRNIIDLTGKSPPEIIYSIAKKSHLVVSNDTGPGHIAALSKTNTLFLALDNIISKSNLSEYKNAFKILCESMDKILVDDVLKFLDENKLISK